MSRSPTPVLKIQITPSMAEAMQKWISRFNEGDLAWWNEPKLEGSVLVINSFDVPDFIRTATADESSQMDIHHLKKIALEAIDTAIKRSRSKHTLNSLNHAREWTLQAPLGEWQGKVVREERKQCKPGERLTRV